MTESGQIMIRSAHNQARSELGQVGSDLESGRVRTGQVSSGQTEYGQVRTTHVKSEQGHVRSRQMGRMIVLTSTV